MGHRQTRRNAPLQLLIAAVVAGAWILGVVTCCPIPQRESSAASITGVGHAVAGHAHHGAVAPARTAVISRACAHTCTDMSTAAAHARQAVDPVAPTVAVAVAVLAAPFVGPVVAGTRDPPTPIRAVHDHLGRNILTRICICRR